MKFMVRLISYSFSLFALQTVTCKLQCVGGYFVTRVTWRDSHTAARSKWPRAANFDEFLYNGHSGDYK